MASIRLRFDSGENLPSKPSSAEENLRGALHEFLGIPPDKTVTHYTLLGLDEGEDNPDVINNAADRQMAYLRNFQLTKKFGGAITVQKLLNEVSLAKITLLKKKKDPPALILVDDGTADTRTQAEAVIPTIVTTPSSKKQNKAPSWFEKNWKAATGVAGTITAGIALTVAHLVSGAGNEKKESPDTEPTTPVVRPVAAGEGPKQSISKEYSSLTEPITTSTPDVTPLVQDNNPEIDYPSATTLPTNPTFAVGFNAPAATTEAPEPQEPQTVRVPKRTGLADLLPPNPGTPPTNPPPVSQPAATPKVQKEETQFVIDPTELKAKRAEINADFVPGKFGLDKAKILRELHGEPEILKDPIMLKAVIVEWFTAGKEAPSATEMEAAIAAMAQYPQLFTAQELERCRAIVRATKAAEMLESTKVSGYKFPNNVEKRQQNARAFLALASEAAADGNPDQADEFLKNARSSAVQGNQPDRQFAGAFKNESEIVQRQIAVARSKKAAKDQLEKNPNDPEAHRILGELSYVDGNINDALTHLAQSNSKLSSIAQKTLDLLSSNNPNAKECFDTAFEWDSPAKPAGSDTTTRSIQRELLQRALTTDNQNPPLTTAEKVRINMLLKQKGGSVPTNGTNVASGSSGGNGGRVEFVKEPMRPKFVHKDAVWNPETGSWYYAVSTEKPISLRESIMYAARNQAQLFVPNSESENAFVHGILKRSGLGSVALGITKRNDGWYSPSGGKLEYFNWNPGEPSGGQTELAAFLKIETGGWDDMNLEGDEFTAIVLEWPLKHK